MQEQLLSICIPTWNRAEILDENLTDLIDKIAPYKIEIVVCDNVSTDNTSAIVAKHQLIYPHIRYYLQGNFVGVDINFETCLKLAAERTQYAWLLGDSYRIVPEHLERILDLLLDPNNYSTVVINAFNRVDYVKSGIYDNTTRLLRNLGWHMTLMSALIFSKRVIQEGNFRRYYESNFIQSGIIFEYLTKHKQEKIYFLNENCVTVTKLTKISWQHASFKVFCKNWVTYVLSLPPDIPLNVKLDCIKEHNIKVCFFNLHYIYDLKKQGWLDYERDVKPYLAYIPYASPTKAWRIVFISKVPMWIAKLFKHVLSRTDKFERPWNDYYRLKSSNHIDQ